VAELVVGPLLRYVGEREATVWMETDAACEVEVLGRRVRTFQVEGHHYALVMIEDLKPGSVYEYELALDGERRWPPPSSDFPPSVIRTLDPGASVRLAFGSCRVSVPHDAPYNLSKDDDDRGREVDALYALALRMIDQPMEEWPQVLLLLGDQVYADEVSPEVHDFIRSRRDVRKPPGEEVADFEEYTRLYWESWKEPVFRWLASTVSTAMIFDDHDVHDDWNTSRTWVDDIRREPWWDERVTAGLVSYWIYQHIGNLSPRELRENGMLAKAQEADDAGPLLRRFAFRTDREASGWRWSYHRDLGKSRLIVMDSRAGRVLEEGGRRTMVDDNEWSWIVDHSTGDFDHLLYATSLPYLLSPGMHFMEAWNERLCDGAWGQTVANLSEKLRQAVDLEHWSAFGESFEALTRLLCEVGSGGRGKAPASIVVLSGDVHHAYLADVAFRRDAGVESAVYQAVCSPVRNPLGAPERAFMRAAASPAMRVVGRALATAARVPDPGIRWRLDGGQKFDNQIATLDLDRRSALLTLERTQVGGTDLHESLRRRLA
jgi:hypothetical protein